jgi:hypothetical protein
MGTIELDDELYNFYDVFGYIPNYLKKHSVDVTMKIKELRTSSKGERASTHERENELFQDESTNYD